MSSTEVEVDELDLKILDVIKNDAKLSVREIAKILNKSPSTILSRIKKLERVGVIKGYATLIDYSKLNYQVTAITLLQVEGPYIEEVEKLLASEPNVRAVYDVTGEYDVIVISLFKTVSELDNFIKRLLKVPHIRRSITSIAFRVIKDNPNIDKRLI
ncbi:MAG: Lrp/AsnC family transcriptional regulator [Desulfurococcaceae archaeon]|nr:Lrp/AsnC family transcriptional regulator [Desulfurococcaceae archaeon]